MRQNLLLGLILSMVFLSGSQLWADPQGCSICGMDLSKYSHVRYVVTLIDGKTQMTCGVQCGLTLQIRLGDQFKSAMATDLISHREVEASKAFYVYRSSVTTDMAPGFIAFSTKEKAENFAKGFGGKVVNHREALEIWKEQMK